MNIVVFSSPLQYLFAHLVIKQLSLKNVIGVYYIYQKDFSTVFNYIDNILLNKIDKCNMDEIEGIMTNRNLEAVFFSNRFSQEEVTLFHKVKGRASKICLYEEGANFYLQHFFLNKNINDNNFVLKLKNMIKQLVKKNASHIYISQIDEIYSVFDLEFLPKNVKRYSLFEQFQKLQSNGLTKQSDSCLILSQWFVEHNYLSEDEYIYYINHLVKRIEHKYKNIYYKPHPRDAEKLNMNIYKNPKIKCLKIPYNEVPVELFIAKQNLDLYGFWSSAMFYINSAWDVDVFSLFQDLVNMYPENLRIKEMYDNDVKPLLIKHKIKEY